MNNLTPKQTKLKLPETIARFFDFELNDSQIIAVIKILQFLKSNDKIFILRGYAGTGKTTLLKGLTNLFNHYQIPFACMAPTGRAAKVLSETTGFRAHTIHKSIYSKENLLEYKTNDAYGFEIVKYFYSIRNNEDSANTIYIVDEASMISNQYANGEYLRFGTGYLLNDFLSYVGINNKRKIIFVGDPAQLPPVNMETSPALDKNYLENISNLIQVQEYEMHTIVRQNLESGILNMATKIRQQIDQAKFRGVEIDLNHRDILPIPVNEIARKYISLTDNLKSFRAIIIAHTNYAVNNYNQIIREKIWGHGKDIQPGDRIIVVQNNYYYEIELLNGEFGLVVDVNPNIETHEIFLRSNDQTQKITLSFRDLIVRFETENGEFKNVRCKILMNLLNLFMPSLSKEEMLALYLDFKNRHPNLKPNTAEFKEAIRRDPYFNCLRIKFGYAVTCHKAQGGEWEYALIDPFTSHRKSDPMYYHWSYTAVTRAKNGIYFIFPESIKQEDLMQWTKVTI